MPVSNRRIEPFRLVGFVVGIFVIVLGAHLIHAETAGAAAGSAGGSGSGTGNGFNTMHGWGWYKYEIGVTKPDYVESGNWNDIAYNRCSGYRYVVGFTLLNKDNPKKAAIWGVQALWWNKDTKKYNYPLKPTKPTLGPASESNYMGRSGWGGNGWISWDNARQDYSGLIDDVRDGTHWIGDWGYEHTASNIASWFCYEEKTNWTLSGSSSFYHVGNQPGQTIRWNHSITNNGPTRINNTYIGSRTHTTINGVEISRSNDEWGIGFSTPSGGTVRSWPNTPEFSNNYTIKYEDVGKTICQWVSYEPHSSWDGSGRTSNQNACVYIPFNYQLEPSLGSSTGRVSVGEQFEVTRTVTNGGTTQSDVGEWRFYVGKIDAGKSKPTTSVVNHDSEGGCFQFNQVKPCTEVVPRTGENVTFKRGVTDLNNYPDIASDVKVGDHICYILSVRPRSHDSAQWRSRVHCIQVVKKPTVQVWGGDVRVGASYGDNYKSSGSSIIAPRRTIDSKVYGSWGEYGMLVSSLDGFSFSSSGGSISGMGAAPGTDLKYNPLSFTNTRVVDGVSVNGHFGGWGGEHKLPTVNLRMAGEVIRVEKAETIKLDAINKSVYYHYTNLNQGRVKVEGKNKGYTIVIYVDGDVDIMGDITLDDTLSANSMGQTIIVARNIIINHKVGRVDAWLVARPDDANSGLVATCVENNSANNNFSDYIGKPYYTNLAAGVCGSQLTINGPIIAKELWLRRTSGAETVTDQHQPAEIVNFRPDAYLWAMQETRKNGSITTGMTYEIPPRF